MTVPLPNLDDRTYAELESEARSLIPALLPEWTDHNPADPGITLIELFAWLTEMLLYRINRVPEEHYRTFLKLLNGPAWQPGPDLQQDVRDAVLALRRRERAVTAGDYEALARRIAGVGRAHCVPRRDLELPVEADRTTPRPGHVSLILVPDTGSDGSPDPPLDGPLDPASEAGAPLPSATLIEAVEVDLEPRRLLTTRHHVVGPIYAPVRAEILLARRPDVLDEPLARAVETALASFLDPLGGGPEGDGWRFGRDLHVSELHALLDAVPGVDYVPDVVLSSRCPPDAERCVEALELWHPRGEQIGLHLPAHHLPWHQPGELVIGAAFVAIVVRVPLTNALLEDSSSPPPAARLKNLIKRLFHPLHGGPNGREPWQITARKIAEQASLNPADVVIEAPPDRLFDDGQDPGVRLERGELANVRIDLEGPS